jgi:hypothetical protein
MKWLNLFKKFGNKRISQAFENNGHKKPLFSERAFFEIIERERERANRHDHKFSLIVLDLEVASTNYNTIRFFVEKILNRVRVIDEIGWYGPKRIGIVLPYTDARGAQEFSDSLYGLFDSSLPVSVCTIYTYPSDEEYIETLAE